jgi:hypothetical protein
MGLRFYRRVQIMPGLRINFSRSGPSMGRPSRRMGHARPVWSQSNRGVARNGAFLDRTASMGLGRAYPACVASQRRPPAGVRSSSRSSCSCWRRRGLGTGRNKWNTALRSHGRATGMARPG